MITISVQTHQQTELIDITSEISTKISKLGVEDGICHIFVPHTTAAVTINEGADPAVKRDIIYELNKIIPFNDGYHHAEGNSAAHIKTSLVGTSEHVMIENGRLVLGTWQVIYFAEFDGPRSRKVYVKIV